MSSNPLLDHLRACWKRCEAENGTCECKAAGQTWPHVTACPKIQEQLWEEERK